MSGDHPELSYLELLRRVSTDGEAIEGRNGRTRNVFGCHLAFDIGRAGFPLFTTKRVFWKGIVEELLWFIAAGTDTGRLREAGVHIWDANATREFLDSRGLHQYPEGVLGPIYGWQWRRFNQPFAAVLSGGEANDHTTRTGAKEDMHARNDNGADRDQLRAVLSLLCDERAGLGHTRRALMSAWNPCQLAEMALPPCHVSYQFSIGAGGLSCMLFARSQDLCCGTPFNVASTALLTALIAASLHTDEAPLGVDRIHLAIGDAHVYDAHLKAVPDQLARAPRPWPTLRITRPSPPAGASVDERLSWIEGITAADILLDGYDPWPAIKYTMVP